MRYICALTSILIIVIIGLYKLGIIPFNDSNAKNTFNYDNEKTKTNISNEEIYSEKTEDNNKEKNRQEIEAIIISSPSEKNYYDCYTIKYKSIKYYMYAKKQTRKLQIGDIVKVNAIYIEPPRQKNFHGFDYNIYLRSKNIHGIFKAESIKKIGKSPKTEIKIIKFFDTIRQKMMKIYEKELTKNNSAILGGLTIGDKTNIDEKITENFRNANLSHVLAISGAHLSYIILGISLITKKIKIKRFSQILTIFAVMFFVFLTGMSASVTRAGLMCVIPIIASILKRKNDFYTTMCLSILIQIIFNPYVIFDIGFILSYAGVIGIVLFFNNIYTKIHLKITSVSISANIILMPIMAFYFNTISIAFLFSNLIASILLGPIIILGFISIIFRFKILFFIINILISILLKSTEFFAKLTFLRSNIVTPSLISIIIYYLILLIINQRIKQKTKEQTKNQNTINPIISFRLNKMRNQNNEHERKEQTKNQNTINPIISFRLNKIRNQNNEHERKEQIKDQNITNLIISYRINKIKIQNNKKKTKQKPNVQIKRTIIFLILIQIISNVNYINFDKSNLYINFIDVGQGDCTIIRYKNISIMIDSGGSDNNNYDIGKNVLMRSLLSKKIKKLDYIMISHFDADHCQGFMYLLRNFKIKNAIICEQGENSKYYEELLKISKEKKINIIFVKRGNSFFIDKIKFQILNPQNKSDFILKNVMNNNAIVCKITFYNFSVLFTGDIEKEAEENILNRYKKDNILKSNVLKIAHHGSKTSSTEDFLNKVNPNIALIGVGENNKFGHPNKTTIEKLKKRKIKIYRTDLNGEIYIKVNKTGKIKVKTKILQKRNIC